MSNFVKPCPKSGVLLGSKLSDTSLDKEQCSSNVELCGHLSSSSAERFLHCGGFASLGLDRLLRFELFSGRFYVVAASTTGICIIKCLTNVERPFDGHPGVPKVDDWGHKQHRR